MKTNVKKFITGGALSACVFAGAFLAIFTDKGGHERVYLSSTPKTYYANNGQIAYAAEDEGIFKYITPEAIAVYEDAVAKEPIISGMNRKKLEKLAERMHVSEQKMKGMLLLKDLAERTGAKLSLRDMTSYTDLDFFKTAAEYAKKYLDGLPPLEREIVKTKLDTVNPF